MRFDYEALEEGAGHNLTNCGMVMPGTTLYVCENCGAVLLNRQGDLILFHVHRGSESTQEACKFPQTKEPPATIHIGLTGRRVISRPTLKLKLEAIIAEDWQRISEDI